MPRWSARAKRVSLLVAGQAAFWLLLQPLLSPNDPPPPPLRLSEHRVAAVAISDNATAPLTAVSVRTLLDTIAMTPTTLPWRTCESERLHVLRSMADVRTVPEDGFGVLPRLRAENAWLFVNGHFVAGSGTLTPVDRVALRAVWQVPASAWKVGTNRVDLVAVSATGSCTAGSGVWVAPWFVFRDWIGWRQLLQREFAWSAVAITGVLALLGLTLWLRGNRERTLGWATVLLATWALQVAGAAIPTLPFLLRVVGFTGTRLLFMYALIELTESAGSAPIPRWRTALRWGVMVCGVVEVVWMLLASDVGNALALSIYSMVVDLLLVSIAVVLGARRLLRNTQGLSASRAPEALFLSLMFSVLALDLLRKLFDIGGSGDLTATFALLSVAMAIVFAARTATEYRSAGQVTQILSARLTQKEQELATVFAEQRESARHQARLEERSRLMRDMHDGIGGRLLSLEAQLRHSSAPPSPPHIADELRGALDELRLIVDSLDTAGDDLGVALGAFRGRMAPRLRAAGLTLDWSVNEDATTPPLAASAVLDVYRILQEACTNVLRHAGATRFRVSLQRLPDGRRVLEMHDNGVGMPTDAEQRGRGVANMQVRATRLGGRLSLRDGEPGTCLRLELPVMPAL
ncbi:MAG: hypothetical protein IT353_24140 [Gemmatimonadaceae bacterium]|nr:hypothetical protein [Gemmatimonadaceae bacterium]